MKKALALAGTFLAVALHSHPARATDAADGFYRYPSIGGGNIVFASEGDLWKVPAAGGVAQRLTTHEGDEKFPRISPDGKLLPSPRSTKGTTTST